MLSELRIRNLAVIEEVTVPFGPGFNVLTGERYQIVTREVTDYIAGMYGRPPGEVSKELLQKVVGDKVPDYKTRAGDLADPELWDKTVKELGPLAKSDEDLLLGVLFPMQAREIGRASCRERV